MDDKKHQERQEREHFFGAAKIMAALTLASRFLGMWRDMAITWLGADRLTDAFQMAFAIPNLFRRLFGEGALSAAFVPVFTETIETSGLDKARRLLANAMGLLSVFLTVVMILVLAGLQVWGALAPAGDAAPAAQAATQPSTRPASSPSNQAAPAPATTAPSTQPAEAIKPGQDRKLLILLTSLMMPFMVSTCLLALGSAALNCRGHFTFPALAPCILNVCMIAGAMWANHLPWNKPDRLTLIALSVTAAGVVQLVAIVWVLRASGFPLQLRLRPVDEGVRKMVRMMAPMLLGVGLLQISSLMDYVVAWVLTKTPESPQLRLFGLLLDKPLLEGVLVRYNAANRLYQFPMGVLAISLGVAVFPLLSRYAARGDMPNFRLSLNRAIRLAVMEGLATGVGLFVLADPIIRLIFRHGEFTAADAGQSAFVLEMYVLGMWAYCTYQILTRAFYSLQDTITPLKVSCTMVSLYMVLVVTLVWVPGLGAGAFGIATAVTATCNTLTLAWLLRRRLGLFGGRKIAASVLRSGIASAAMAAAVLALRHVMDGRANWLVVSVCVPVGAAVFIAVARLLRAPELGELFGAFAAKLGRKSQTDSAAD